MENANRMPEIAARLVDPDFSNGLAEEARVVLANLQEAADAKDEIALAAITFDRVVERTKRPLDAACAAIANVVRVQQGAAQSFVSDVRSPAGNPTGHPGTAGQGKTPAGTGRTAAPPRPPPHTQPRPPAVDP